MTAPLLEAHDLQIRFGGVIAADGVASGPRLVAHVP